MTSKELNKELIIQAFQQAAASYDGAAKLQQEVGERLLERLELIRLQPQTVLDIGCGTGYVTRLLEKRYPQAKILALDIATNMLRQARKRSRWFSRQRYLNADMAQLPLADQSVEMIVSNLALYWSSDVTQVFQEWQRVLKPGGLLMFTTLGPDTLKELRNSWQAVDSFTHVNPFVDMHDIGDGLMQAHLAEPVMEAEYITMFYQEINYLFKDLKVTGEKNISDNRSRSLTGKQVIKKVLAQYEQYRTPAGLFPVTYEVIFGHAWGAAQFIGATADQHGVARIPIGRIGRGKKG